MRKFILLLLSCLYLVPVGSAVALGNYPSASTGFDVSWPNCAAQPSTGLPFGVVGINDGRVFTGNPCLRQEAAWFPNLALYLSTSFPGRPLSLKYPTSPKNCQRRDASCLAYNYGYNAAKFALTYASLHDVHSTSWWLDVETVNSWTNNTTANIASLQGMVDALRHYTVLPSIGFYAYPGQWQTLTGGWHNDLTAWVATGSSDRRNALAACHQASFTGSGVNLTQYITKLDRDYVCP